MSPGLAFRSLPVREISPVESAPVARAPARWPAIALFVSLVAAAALNPLLPALMSASGRPGTEFIALALVPLFGLAARSGAWGRAVLRPMLLMTVILAASLMVGSHTKDGAVKVFVTLSGVMWAAVALGDGRPLERIARWGAGVCVIFGAASIALGDELPRPSHLLALAVLAARMILEEARSPRPPRPTEVLVDVALVGLIFLSTFRAATLAAGIVLAAAAFRLARARWALLVCALCALPVLVAPSIREPTYSSAVARDDWQGRYGSLGEDRLSGRADIWENVWRDVRDGPSWLLTGHGAGDVDLYVARVNPMYHAHLRDDERAVHTHNTALEMFLSAGVLGLLPVVWIVALAVSRARRVGVQLGCSLGVLVVSMSNVPTMDWTGGTLLIAVWLYALDAAEERARSIDPGAGFAHGPAPRTHHDPPRVDATFPGREALS